MEKQINMKCFAVSNENKISQYNLKILLSHSNLYPLDKLLNHFTNDEKYFILLYFSFTMTDNLKAVLSLMLSLYCSNIYFI